MVSRNGAWWGGLIGVALGLCLALVASGISVSAPASRAAPPLASPTPDTFADVPSGFWAHDQIESLAARGITTGCGTTDPVSGKPNYCPGNPVTRDQMAGFLVRAKHGSTFTPPAAVGLFNDVPTTDFFARFIEQAFADGITTGCVPSSNPATRQYCPHDPVTRDQMAGFLERAVRGGSFQPPAALGAFADVPTADFFAPWIEQLARDGITTGCGTTDPSGKPNYCPHNTVTRDQMAVFIGRAFPGP